MQATQAGTRSLGQPAGLARTGHHGNEFLPGRSGVDGSAQAHLPDALFRHIEPHLDRLGGLAGGTLDECARLADRHTPVLHQRDRFGRDSSTSNIIRPIANWRRPRSASSAFTHCRSARASWAGRTNIPSSPSTPSRPVQPDRIRHGLPDNVTDGCAKLLNNFGSDELKARYLDGLTQTDMTKLTQGGQFMTEKEGGSDVGTLTTTAVQEGDHWRSTARNGSAPTRTPKCDAAGAAGRRRPARAASACS